MYRSIPSSRRSEGGPLPPLPATRDSDEPGPSTTLSFPASGSSDGDAVAARFGKAWSSPASVSGTRNLPSTEKAALAAREFTLSSSSAGPATSSQWGCGAEGRHHQPSLDVLSSNGTRAAAANTTTPGPLPSRRAAKTLRCDTDDVGDADTDGVEGRGSAAAAPAPRQLTPQPRPNSPLLARSNATATKLERVSAIDHFLTTHAASYTPEPQRNGNVRRALEDVARVYPALSPITLQVSRYVKEIGSQLHTVQEAHAAALSSREKELRDKFEHFFEDKILALLSSKKALEQQSERLHAENYALRQERDEELATLKGRLMTRLNECEKREDEFRSYRQLIAAVFKTNEQLSNRVEDLELLLKQHRIEVPPADEEMFRYSPSSAGTWSGGGKDGEGGGRGGANANATRRSRRREEAGGKSNLLPPAFMQASKEELNLSRLTLQQELLHCAFDDRTAYRLKVAGLQDENTNLRFELSNATATVEKLNRYIYEKRFMASPQDADGNAVQPMTPRPRDVPFSIETELGVDLKASTGSIVSELAAVATNLKHQLNSALLRLRQATTVSEWMSESTLVELDMERNGGVGGVLPTFPVGVWASIPHFLRTTIHPDVDNLRWSPSDIAAVLLEFFQRYAELRSACRFTRDKRMVAPREYQQFERREVVLTRLDATKEEVVASEEAVPFGYVVSEFVRTVLMGLTSGSWEAALVLPGSLHPRFVVRGEEKVVELEFTRFAYNVWWAAQRYRDTQPLCRLFLDVVDGRLPVGVFAATEEVLAGVKRFVQQRLDLDGSHTLPYQRLVGGVSRVVADMDAQATRCGVLAVTQTFEENQLPIMGGRVRLDALIADESHCLPEAALTTEDAGGNGAEGRPSSPAGTTLAKRTVGDLPPSITTRRVPAWQLQPLGASVFVRYWRQLVLERYERVYALVERVMAPLVVESDVVLGLYLLPVPEALARAGCLDDNVLDAAATHGTRTALLFSDGAVDKDPAQDEEALAASDDGKEGTTTEVYARAAAGVPKVTKSYAALLEHRRKAVHARRAADRTLVAALVKDVLESLPRLNRSVHFPFPQTDAVVEEGAAAAGDGGAKATHTGSPSQKKGTKAKEGRRPRAKERGDKKATQTTGARQRQEAPVAPKAAAETGGSSSSSPRAKRKSAESEIVPMDMVTTPDKELTEWYGFCFALRQHPLSFPEYIFSDEFVNLNRPDTASSAGHDGENENEDKNGEGGDTPFAATYDEDGGRRDDSL